MVRHIENITPTISFCIPQAKLQECVKLLDDYKQGERTVEMTDEKLWSAQKTVQSIIHPDTGKKIFMPFRMSGYVPFGTPIVSNTIHHMNA